MVVTIVALLLADYDVDGQHLNKRNDRDIVMYFKSISDILRSEMHLEISRTKNQIN